MQFYIFNILFAFYIVAVALLVWRLFLLWKSGRPSWLRIIITALLALDALILFYGWLIEPQIITTVKHDVNLGGSTEVRAVVISDIQVGPVHGRRFVERIVNKINALEPDLVLYAGDFVENRKEDVEELALLASIQAPLGVYGVLGDHDVAGKTFAENDEDKITHVLQRLKDFNVKMLVNETAIITKNNQSWLLAGVDEFRRNPNLPLALKDAQKDLPLVVLSHKPDIIDVARMMNADLVIAGHTHGGQIRLPWLGAFYNASTIPLKFSRGLFTQEFSPTALFVTSGLGESIMPFRFLNPPEIAVLNISL